MKTERQKKFLFVCDRGSRWSIYASAYFLPISIALTESFAGLALIFFFAKKIGEAVSERSWKSLRPQSSYLSWPIAVFIGICAISLFVSQYRMLSLQGFFFKVLEWTFLYFIVLESFSLRRHVAKLLLVASVSALIVNFNGFYQYVTGSGFIFGHLLTDGRINSSFRHPNDFGAYLVLTAPLFLNLLLRYSPRGSADTKAPFWRRPFVFKGSLFFLLGLALFCLGLTYSRGAWIGFFMALIALAFTNRRNLLPCAVILTVFLVVFIPKLKETRRMSIVSDNVRVAVEEAVDSAAALGEEAAPLEPQEFLKAESPSPENLWAESGSFIKKIFDVGDRFGGSGRRVFWTEALEVVKKFPFLGTGLNTYARVASQYDINGGYAHNCYLQMAVEIGLIGLASFLWIFVLPFQRLIFRAYRYEDVFLYAVSRGALIGLLGFLLHSFFDTNFYSVQLGNLMWLVLGLIVVSEKIDTAQKQRGLL